MACDGNFEPVDDGCVCPPDHYLNATDNCLPCTGFDPQCSKCDLPNNCTACNGGMMPDGTGGCSCPPKYFWDDLHSSPPECVSCSMFADQLCDECDVHGCTSCLNNLVLDSAGFCGCPDSGTYFDDFNGACVNCTMYEAHCASCDEFGCLDCGAGGMIPDGVLGCACPAGTYLKPATDTCSPCTDFGPACTVCGADGGCTACSGGLTPDGQGGCK
ncbi:hypothetical protein Rsub_11339 [Raphidocelis subcapitata]|uniref:Uncharacterized protein n=1 Tax=Raphidocelis subcapitata TaxID=307507 RepID=A0A2V0PIN8_9CHLO|nr:hypothetical protein Rsub_11339 [Raphidocelis subcapitata]|eukprot:GBF97813.1 hypothetical protein Rsub_11339 [Raphidocelis subcapitata]